MGIFDSDADIDSMVSQVFTLAKNYNVKRAVILNKRQKQKFDQLVSIENRVFDDFVKVFSSVLRERKILFAKPVNPNSKQYMTLREIAKAAYDFCKINNLDFTEGYAEFTNIAIDILKNKYSIFRLKGIINDINNYYQVKKIIENDPDKEFTSNVYKEFQSNAQVFYNILYETSNPMEYIHFYYIKETCKQLNVDYKYYIKHQFSLLNEFIKEKCPSPHLFYGEKAINRFSRTKHKMTEHEKELLQKNIITKTHFKRENTNKKNLSSDL